MRREERVTVQGPVNKQQPNGMSHRGGGGGQAWGQDHVGDAANYLVFGGKLPFVFFVA